jgi:predicted nucleotidyltransferase
MDIEESLFNQLGIKIDLITVGSLNTHVKPFILKDLKLIN